MAGKSDHISPGQPVRLSAQAWNSFVDLVRKDANNKPVFYTDPDGIKSNQRYWAVVTSTLCSGAFQCPTACSVDVWLRDETSENWPQPMIRSTNPNLLGLPVINRDGNLTATPGDIVKIEWDDINAEFSIYWKGKNRACSSSSSSSSSKSTASGSTSSGSTSGSANCGCVTVVTSVGCGPGGLSVTYGTAKGCCE